MQHSNTQGTNMNLYEKTKQKFDDLFKKPLSPVDQVDPTRSQQIVASEYLGIPAAKQVIKGTVPKQRKSLREQLGYSRRDVVAILDKIEARRLLKKDQPLLPERDTKIYRRLAANNSDLNTLAQLQGISAAAFKVFLADVEKAIIEEAQFLRQRFGVKITEGLIHQPDEAEPTDEGADVNEAIVAEAQENDQRDAGLSGGASIGGRIIIRGKDSTGKLLKLDTFERGGTLRMTQEQPGEESNTSREVEHDDYSADSRP
jgi:hypothetical protein